MNDLTQPQNGQLPERVSFAVRPGVNTPDWSIVTSEVVGDTLEALFETCNWSERWAGLSEAEDGMRRLVLETFARSGRAPLKHELVLTTGLAPEQVQDLLVKLSDRDMVVVNADNSEIIGAYPFVERQTEHRLKLDDTALYAMCAIDALGTGAMLGMDIKVVSACRYCHTPVRFKTGDKGLKLASHTPEQTNVWVGRQYADGCAANSLCTTMAFFCSDAHLDSWRSEQSPPPKGVRLSFEEGFQLGKAIFMPLLAPAEPY